MFVINLGNLDCSFTSLRKPFGAVIFLTSLCFSTPRRRFVAAGLPGLWIRISPGHGILYLVNVVFSQLEVSVLG